MAITHDEVLHVARLARLELTDDESDKFTEQLSAILEAVAKVSELDLSDVEPTAHPLDLVNVWADDDPRPSLPVDEALANARTGTEASSRCRPHDKSSTHDAELCRRAAGAARGCVLSRTRISIDTGAPASFPRTTPSTSATSPRHEPNSRHAPPDCGGRGGPRRARRGVWPELPAPPTSTRSASGTASFIRTCARWTRPTAPGFRSRSGPDHDEGRRDDSGVEDPLRVCPRVRLDGGGALPRGRPVAARQDEHGRVRHGLVDGELRLRPDPQSVGSRARARRFVRRLGRCESPRASLRGRSGRTRAARSSSRPPSAGSSACARPTEPSRATGSWRSRRASTRSDR